MTMASRERSASAGWLVVAACAIALSACGAKTGLDSPRATRFAQDAGQDAGQDASAPLPCGGRCNDRVACTVDTCDEASNECVYEPDSSLCPLSHRCDLERGCLARAVAHDANFLYDIDLPSGAIRRIGETPRTLTDVALSDDGVLYAAYPGELLRIDVDTGSIEYVAPMPGAFYGSDIDEAGDIYGGSDDRIERFDIASGTTTLVARLPSGFFVSGDLGFVGGRLYVTATRMQGGEDTLFVVNIEAGLAFAVGATGERCIWGLAPFGTVLYGLTCNGRLVRINTATGAATHLASPGVRFYGAAAR